MHLVMLGIGLAVAGLLGALTLNRRGERPERIFLAGWLTAYGAAFLGWILSITLGGALSLVASAAASSALMLTPSLSWMYARVLGGEPPQIIWPHFLPSILNFAVILLLWRLSAAASVDGAVLLSGPPELALLLIPAAVILAMCVYPVLAWRIAGRGRDALKDLRSDETIAAFTWVRIWAATTFLLLLAFLAANLAVNLRFVSLPLYMTTVFAAIALQIAYVAFHGLRENAAFLLLEPPAPARTEPKTVDPARASELAAFMTSHQPYLDPSLNIDALSAGVGWDRAEVSAAIRQSDSSFFDYVNRFRVEEAKRLLSTQENVSVTILSIGLDSGFGSKSAFNAAFRKAANMTPTQFRASVNLSND